MLKKYRADLHIHTCLSPCAELEMTPSAIIKASIEKGIDIIAITDHNSAENIPAAIKAAEGSEITILAGMEITSSEEAHILALFDSIKNAMKLQDVIYTNLLPGKNDERRFGEQVVVNEKDEVLHFNERLLITATTMSSQYILNTIHKLDGIAIASHIDREAFSIVSQLGFIPEDLDFDALEMSPRISRTEAEQLFATYTNTAWVTSSDAHRLSDVGRRSTYFYLEEPTTAEMKMAMKNMDGRKIEWEQ